MGLLSWLFPTPEARIAKANKHLEAGRWAKAREEVFGLEEQAAQELLVRAETELAKMNLEAALSWGRAGDDIRVDSHLELAERFHHGGLEKDFRLARKELRELRAARRAEEKAKQQAKEQRLLQHDPLAFVGGDGGGGDDAFVQGPAPLEIDGPDAEETAARVAFIVDAYPQALRERISALGSSFARAVLDLEDGRPDVALQELLQLPDDEPLVLYERARCAHALGSPAAATSALTDFARWAEGHHAIGPNHTGVMLAQMTAEAGDPAEALRILRDVRVDQPRAGGVLFAQLLEASGELAEADQVLRGLIAEHPRQRNLYKLLARIRIKGGERLAAIQALESSLSAVCCTPGKCGYQAPDPEIQRSLAILYLEEGIEPRRAREVAEEAQALVGEPTWEDAYLGALLARAESRPEAEELAQLVRSRTPPDDPRAARVRKHLGVAP